MQTKEQRAAVNKQWRDRNKDRIREQNYRKRHANRFTQMGEKL